MLTKGKAVGPGEVSVELFKIALNSDPALRRRLLDIVGCICREGGGAAAVENAIITVLHSKKDWTGCGNYRGIALLANAGKILLKIISCCFSEFGAGVGILPEEQKGFQNCSTTDTLFVIRRLQELAWKKRITLHICFIEHTTTQDGVDRTILWTVFTLFSVLQSMVSVTHEFHNGMRACVRLDDGVSSRRLAVKHGLRRGRVLVPLLFNLFFAVVIDVAYTSFKVDRDIMDALMHPRKKMGGRGRGEKPPESHPCRHCHGTRFMLTTPESFQSQLNSS